MTGRISLLAGMATAMLVSAQASATIVRFNTNMGSFDVNLYDRGTPATVANFLSYVNGGAFTSGVMHRSVTGFVVQGGAYRYAGAGQQLATVTTSPPVINEPEYSNVRGTIAMAKLPGSVNSATSQWFINTGNNSANLDVQNGGFTVFGQVIGNGMLVVDAINALQTFAISGVGDTVPLQNYTTGNMVTDANLVISASVTIVDASLDTATGLNPAPNTLIDQQPDPGLGGGGATGVGSLLALGLLGLWRQRRLSIR